MGFNYKSLCTVMVYIYTVKSIYILQINVNIHDGILKLWTKITNQSEYLVLAQISNQSEDAKQSTKSTTWTK